MPRVTAVGALATDPAATGVPGSGASSKRKVLELAAVALCFFTAFVVFFAAGSARAATVTDRPLLFNIDGATVSVGEVGLAVDNATGALYSGSIERVYRFHADGTPWPFSSTGLPYITTASTPAGSNAVAVDNSGGANQSRIYVSDTGSSKLYAFAPSGELLWSTAPLSGQPSDVAVDPAGHPYVYVNGTVRKYASSGSPPDLLSSVSEVFGARIDADAAEDLFVVNGFPLGALQKWVDGFFSSTIDPTASDVYLDQSSPTGDVFTAFAGRNEMQQITIGATGGQFRLSFGGAQTADLPFDATGIQIRTALEALPTIGVGNVLVSRFESQVELQFWSLLARSDVDQLLCEDGTTPLSGGSCTVSTTTPGIASDFQEYSAAEALLETYGVGSLNNAQSVAYNPSLDRVYVQQRQSETENKPYLLSVFGPAVTGTVADLTIDSPSSVGIASAHFSGTANPQGTSSDWRFQWRKGEESWAAAQSSPAQALAADASDHTVEFTADALRGGTTYQVRLVAVNTANQLAAASDVETFTTAKAAQAPAVTIDSPTAVTDSGATISGTVNPQGDTADWRVQISTDPACVSGYTDQPLQQIATASASPVNVQYEVAGLLPAQHYCVRILATNSAGATASSVQELNTLDTLPTQVFTAYAAPRTDTSARLNGYVNPEGSEASYRFEYSADGSNWTALPPEQTSEERAQVTVASELSGLEPATTYHYRFVVENDAGSVEADEKVFTTRTTAEMQLPQRGIELVNQPDKGNQNISYSRPTGRPSMVSLDGDRAIWTVEGGLPGGTTGAYVNSLARRTAGGWISAPLVPPAEQQIGKGGYAYKLNTFTADLRSFVFRAALSGAIQEGPPTFVRIDDEQHQDVLATFDKTAQNVEEYDHADMTDDAAHVLFPNPITGQLEELGEPSDVISIMPDGMPSNCGVQFSGSDAGTSGKQWRYGYHRMAVTDASRVYFTSIPNGNPCDPGAESGLYYRDRVAEQTIEVDPGEAHSQVGMIRSTPDGGSIYFITSTAHVPADVNTSEDLYRWDADGGDYACLTCLVADPGIVEGGGGVGNSPVLISDDFSHIYFVSNKQLVPGYGNEGEENIYVLSGGELKFVATTNPAKSAPTLTLQLANLTTDGKTLMFETDAASGELTADPIAEKCISAEGSPTTCAEIYRYEAPTESLECLTCNPDGVTTRRAGSVGANNGFFGLSDDGGTAAFSTAEALVAEDINGGPDVYQWRNGAVGLVSDGETQYPNGGFFAGPKVYGIDATGDNIFFTLVDADLTGYERDGLSNLYDARVGGGFPRPSEPAHCSEESCQGPLQAPPAVVQGASATHSGLGNVQPSPSCSSSARQTQKLNSAAARLRKVARQLSANDSGRARQMRQKASRLEKQAKRLSHGKRRCRQGNREAAK